MNKVLSLVVLLVSLCGAGSGLHAAAAPKAKAPAPTPAPTVKLPGSTPKSDTTVSPAGTWERIEAKVLKVFNAKDDTHIYRSYLVQWNGQEVIVEDSLARTNYQVGETIAVLVTKDPYPQGKESYGLLRFSVMPPVPRK